jgi:hypothetical protein
MNIKYADFFHLAPQFADRFEYLARGNALNSEKQKLIDPNDKRILYKFRRLFEKLRLDLLAPGARITIDAELIAFNVLAHIDEMYPAMWTGVPKTARTSLRNTIIRQINFRQGEQT